MIDRSLGGLYRVAGAGLDFNEAQYILVPADQVNFPTAAWRTEVAGHDYIA